jgi:hypothetical protein
MIEIRNFNNKKQIHGYQERYNTYGLSYRGNWKNAMAVGYHEYHQGKQTRFQIR